ncbi:GntR family transcriptional regulator [Faecalicatena contorta]|uniref:DNA-binding transcriptional regulator YhcF, GntR family n=1 Tax=Faecalicatena contorta TaxID=39482 RepID=A0A316A0T0_9FIRM|nr:GntR family transcriptional regulator [Faecalicatena contorta]PWJ51451.1 DNA-binding transcriptional regulator YhcF (GntR family) [Faecalicatena contorta]SUQ13007.1 DNA-binding transcriptional regulator YhcF, GntR family [Faecalicatena contorta]
MRNRFVKDIIAEKIGIKILNGSYPPGSKLPSIREVAGRENLSTTTVQRTFYELERRGLIYKNQTSGYFVIHNRQLLIQLKMEECNHLTRSLYTSLEKLGYSEQEVTSLLEKHIPAEDRQN